MDYPLLRSSRPASGSRGSGGYPGFLPRAYRCRPQRLELCRDVWPGGNRRTQPVRTGSAGRRQFEHPYGLAYACRRMTGTRSFSPTGGCGIDNDWTSDEFLFSFEGRINRAKYWFALYAGMISCLVRLVFLVFLVFALNAIFGTSVKSVHLNIYDIFNDPPSLPLRVSFGGSRSVWLVSLVFYAGVTPTFCAAFRARSPTAAR